MKECFKCKREKLLSEFYKHSQMSDGYFHKCKVCIKGEREKHRSSNIEKIRAYDRKRASLPHRKKLNDKTCKRFREAFPLKYKAQRMVSNAVRDGKLIKPIICSGCNKEARQIEGHHNDYTRPLDVTWLCAACHRQLHRDLRILE